MPIEQLVRTICDTKQAYTQFGGQRPFGVSILYAGWYSPLDTWLCDVTCGVRGMMCTGIRCTSATFGKLQRVEGNGHRRQSPGRDEHPETGLQGQDDAGRGRRSGHSRPQQEHGLISIARESGDVHAGSQRRYRQGHAQSRTFSENDGAHVSRSSTRFTRQMNSCLCSRRPTKRRKTPHKQSDYTTFALTLVLVLSMPRFYCSHEATRTMRTVRLCEFTETTVLSVHPSCA